MRAGVVSHRFRPVQPPPIHVGFKMMFNKKPAWLRAVLKGFRFKIPHYTNLKN
jgi:hypothetical protein